MLQAYKLRLPLAENRIIFAAACQQELAYLLKIRRDAFGVVRIGTDRDDLAAELQVAPDNVGMWVWKAESFAETGGIHLQPDLFFDHYL